MSNDFPDSVFSNENTANHFCDRKNEENKIRRKEGQAIIYWRVYSFVLNTEGEFHDEQ
jgi:hypothetical protein